MNDPRRLKDGGGAAQRLLDSAEVDAPDQASRRRAALLTSTSGGLARTAAGRPSQRHGAVRTFASWMAVAAAASLPLGFLASRLSTGSATSELGAAPPVIAAEAPADVRAIEQARSALARREFAVALAALDAYERSNHPGTLRPEALALRIRALRESGKDEDASAAMRAFERDYPGHPLLLQARRPE